ncbi:MAG: hypothetical protein ABIJ31_05930 [Pseudomonadota bacterium]
MAQKITLSIPDMLHEKLTQWRSSFNFSKLFQEALTEAIERKETFQKRFSQDLDMPDIINRLKDEKIKWGKKYFELGKQEALRWAKTAHYETLIYVTKIEQYYDLLCDPKMGLYFQQIYRSMDLLPYPAMGPETELSDHDKNFIEGWYSGLCDFWNQVKDKI